VDVCQHPREMSWWLRLGLVLFLAGCTAIVDADQRKLGASPSPCNPKDAPKSCVCLGGMMSVQTCNALGRFDPCRCPTNVAGGPAPVRR
jgi:hypothetical protein